MDTLVSKPADRKRRRHSDEFKRQVIEACLEPGISVAAIALANGLNANYLRRWVREHRDAVVVGDRSEASREIADTGPAVLVPVTLAAEPAPGIPPLEIRLDVRRGGTTVQMAWPVEAAASLGSCLRELLR
ncbi:MAG: transposase [Pseudomonadota bacterium]|nr:transposase [Pseudomonadota bacterium]MDQ1316214.1 transposase [Pseudomonadota bacterium]